MVRKIILGIFISFFVIFTMSHNVNAIQPVINLNNYELVYSNYSNYISCEFVSMANTITSGNNYCRGQVSNDASVARVSSIYTTDTFNSKKGDILNFYLLITVSNGLTESDLKLVNMSNQNLGWNILDWKIVDSGLIKDKLYSTGGIINKQGLNYDLNVDFYQGYQYYRLYEITLISINDDAKHFGLTAGLNSGLFTIDINDAFGAIFNFRLSDFKQYRFAGDEANKEVEEKTQEAVNDSQDSGNSAQSSVEGSTQSLMSAGASIMSALTSAPATDCNININTTGSSRVFTTAIGQLNLCSNVPSGLLNMVQGIVALVFTPIVLYFTYNVITTLYNQFKEYNS